MIVVLMKRRFTECECELGTKKKKKRGVAATERGVSVGDSSARDGDVHEETRAELTGRHQFRREAESMLGATATRADSALSTHTARQFVCQSKFIC